MRSPDVPGGLGPELALDYSSASVDGRTTSSNNQASWVGDGFDLSPGFVERRYVPCAEDMGSGAVNTVKTGDLCWKKENATLSLGGSSSRLVQDSTSGEWHPEDDDGTRVEHLTGANNTARNGEYWKVTTTDGVEYYFGKHQRYSGDSAATNSVLRVPVAGNHPGEPCHGSTFDGSFCKQAYRWMLDYVVTPDGNTMTYFYTKETNRYGRNLNSKSVSYTRGVYLTRIEYGQREGTEDASPAPARVVFTTAERCLGSSCDPGDLSSSTAQDWPDVPFDRICTSTSSCPDRFSPAFFTRKRLTRVETQVRTGGAYQGVDRWDLTQSFPDPGDGQSPALWLSSVRHTGQAGGSLALPDVTFDVTQLANRVEDPSDSAPPFHRMRIGAVHTETGGQISVDYTPTECTPSNLPAEHSNDKRCFPVYYDYEGSTSTELGWFHIHPVKAITELDGTGGFVAVEHHYSYADPGWAYTDDEFLKADYRTWSDWRGYQTVTTKTGSSSSGQERTTGLYFRGLDGDRASTSGGSRSVTVTDSFGATVTDRKEFTGMLREETVYDGTDPVTSTVTDPWRSAVTADDGTRTARMVDVAATRVNTRLGSGGWRTSETSYTYDSHGRVVETDDRGDTSTGSDNLCTRTWYATNTGAWILETVKRVETVAAKCSATPSRPGDVVSDTRSWYDGGGYGAAPTRGNVTRTEELDSWQSGPVYVTTSRSTYDAHGRVTASWDALDRKTATAYTPATGGPVTAVTETNPAGHVTTSTIDPLLGQPTRVVDPNGKATDATYDPLGRLRKVWFTDRDQATQTPSVEYAYRVTTTEPVAVTTSSLLPSGDQHVSKIELYDSLLRPRQTQAPAAGDDGGRVITQTQYDTRGLAVAEGGPYYATGDPAATLVDPSTTLPRQVLSTFDGAGRVTLEQLMVHQEEKARRVTSYGGDRVDVTPPDGATPTTTITDARGQTVAVREYHGGTPTGAYEVTTYRYTPAGDLAGLTDSAGNEWSYTYDLRGRRVGTDDPDAGQSSTSYDAAGQVVSSTDGRGVTTTTSYDVLGRQTAVKDGAGDLLASWTYDTLEKGQLTSSTSYVDGQEYTTAVYGYDDGYRSYGETVTLPDGLGALAGDYVTYHNYNPDGSPNQNWVQGGAGLADETTKMWYDATGRPEWLSGDRTYVADTRWSPFGEVEQYATGPNVGAGQWITFGYQEGTRRLGSVRVDREGVDPADVDRSYTYDPAGNPLRVADTGGPGGTSVGGGDVQCFSYDDLARLASAWTQADPGTGCASGPSGSVVGGAAPYWQDYTYDAAGNRASLTEHDVTASGGGSGPDVVTDYAHPGTGQPGPHALTTASTQAGSGSGGDPADVTSYSYDGAGNTTSVTAPDGSATSYTWDEQGRLAGVQTTDASGAGTGSGSMVYAADGTRLVRRTPGKVTVYVNGDEYTLDTGTGAVASRRYYVFAGTSLVTRDGDGTITTLAADGQGTPLVAIDGDNQLTRRYLDPFGNPRGTRPGAWPGDLGFHTGTDDAWAGLVHMGARPYDPDTGRFLAVDPLIDPLDSQQMNGYAYANNNPVTMTDPTGLIAVGGQHTATKKDYDLAQKKRRKTYRTAQNSTPDNTAERRHAAPSPTHDTGGHGGGSRSAGKHGASHSPPPTPRPRQPSPRRRARRPRPRPTNSRRRRTPGSLAPCRVGLPRHGSIGGP